LFELYLAVPSVTAVADPDQMLGGQSNKGHQKSLHLFKYQRLSATIAEYHTKLVTSCRPRKWLFLLVEPCNFAGNHPRMGLVSHMLHIT